MIDNMLNRQNNPDNWWYAMGDSKKTVLSILGLNTIIFGLWNMFVAKVFSIYCVRPSFEHFMYKYFLSSITHKSSLTLITSMFSHSTVAHFAFNAIAFYTIGSSLCELVGREQMLAIFLGGTCQTLFNILGGLMSSLTSHYFRLALRSPAGSLGASGGVFALLTAYASLNPQANFALIFLPIFPIPASTLVPVLIGFDAIGLTGIWRKMFGWSLDHAGMYVVTIMIICEGHLGGALFGIFYVEAYLGRLKERLASRPTRRR